MKVELLETFITGHATIDAEHAEIVNMINSVSHSIENNEHDKCEELLEAFLVQCAEHFKSEEALLADAEYPGLKDHCVFHEELLMKARQVKALCVNTETPETLKRCFDEMATLLIEDVVRGDMQFVSFLQEKDII